MVGRNFLFLALAAALPLAACTNPTMTATPMLTSVESLSHGKLDPVQTFHLDDRVAQLVDFTWSDASSDGGFHNCEWRWFRDGQLVSASPIKRIWFSQTPYTLRTIRSAGTFGAGHYTVETIVDGDVVATSAFTILG